LKQFIGNIDSNFHDLASFFLGFTDNVYRT
jgi:hypothetical protein